METYLPRLADAELLRKIKSCGAVLVKGPKWCGKSTTCERLSHSKTSLKTTSAIRLAQSDPKTALLGEAPHLIDEWQKVPEIWNLVRDTVDKRRLFGQFILTGSTTPVDTSHLHHSGAGRIVPMVMKPLSLFESGDSNGRVSLSGLFEKGLQSDQKSSMDDNPISLPDIAFLLCRGGWPMAVLAPKDVAVDVTNNYYQGLFNIEDESDDFYEFIKDKDIDLLKMVVKSYARNISTEVKRTTMISDILKSGSRATLDDETFAKYLGTLESLFIVEDMPAWNMNLRSSVAVRNAPVHHFFDPSIALASLGIRPSALLMDLNSMGFFFEDLAVRDLSIYSSSLGASLRHYRDNNGLEVDAILSLENGDYAAIEIKIRSEATIKAGISSLMRFSRQMEENELKQPKFRMILTSHGECTTTDNGIIIVPINFLRP